ncbi:hypothetical protein C8R46DRAFT_1354212 [Mycena filopes]|nr:hypothetical protein C8R46DRAFT_1354212 [Mycena filopes]
MRIKPNFLNSLLHLLPEMRFALCLVSLVLAGNALAAPSVQLMLGALKQFEMDFGYPRNAEVTKSINYTGFAEDIVGRVDVTTTFVGRELNTEYIFGLFAQLATTTSTPLIGIPLTSTLTDIVVQGNLVIATTLREFNWTGKWNPYLQMGIFPTVWELKFLFNDEGQITQYDAILFRASALFADVWPKLAKHLRRELDLPKHTPTTQVLHIRAAIDICTAQEKYCVGANKQYESRKACLDFVLHKIPFGEIWQGGVDTAFCRYVHTPMLPLRPGVHCPHVGPSGGDMCIKRSYADMIEDPFTQSFTALPGNLTLADLAAMGPK